jgi:hypothetical protein
MLCLGEEPGVAGLTSVGVKFEYAQQEALPNTSPSGSAELLGTTKRAKGPKGYIHCVRVPCAMEYLHPNSALRQANPRTRIIGLRSTECPVQI